MRYRTAFTRPPLHIFIYGSLEKKENKQDIVTLETVYDCFSRKILQTLVLI